MMTEQLLGYLYNDDYDTRVYDPQWNQSKEFIQIHPNEPFDLSWLPLDDVYLTLDWQPDSSLVGKITDVTYHGFMISYCPLEENLRIQQWMEENKAMKYFDIHLF